jgi:hypothetical protein
MTKGERKAIKEAIGLAKSARSSVESMVCDRDEDEEERADALEDIDATIRILVDSIRK